MCNREALPANSERGKKAKDAGTKHVRNPLAAVTPHGTHPSLALEQQQLRTRQRYSFPPPVLPFPVPSLSWSQKRSFLSSCLLPSHSSHPSILLRQPTPLIQPEEVYSSNIHCLLFLRLIQHSFGRFHLSLTFRLLSLLCSVKCHLEKS